MYSKFRQGIAQRGQRRTVAVDAHSLGPVSLNHQVTKPSICLAKTSCSVHHFHDLQTLSLIEPQKTRGVSIRKRENSHSAQIAALIPAPRLLQPSCDPNNDETVCDVPRNRTTSERRARTPVTTVVAFLIAGIASSNGSLSNTEDRKGPPYYSGKGRWGTSMARSLRLRQQTKASLNFQDMRMQRLSSTGLFVWV